MTVAGMQVNVRRTVAITSLFLAWLCANGAILDLAQCLAWTRMFASYAETLPVGEALRETFDARKPCALCRAISHAKESQQQQLPQQVVRDAEKLILALETPSPVFLTRPSDDWQEERWMMIDPRINPVPVPPPRA